MSDKWDLRFLKLAHEISKWSKDPSTQCGAVIVDTENRIVSTGFNGFPRGCLDDDSLYADRETKIQRVIHAEMNAIIYAQRQLKDCTIYVWPVPPCDRCGPHIIQSGITRIIAPWSNHERYGVGSRSYRNVLNMCVEANVILEMVSPENMKWEHPLDAAQA